LPEVAALNFGQHLGLVPARTRMTSLPSADRVLLSALRRRDRRPAQLAVQAHLQESLVQGTTPAAHATICRTLSALVLVPRFSKVRFPGCQRARRLQGQANTRPGRLWLPLARRLRSGQPHATTSQRAGRRCWVQNPDQGATTTPTSRPSPATKWRRNSRCRRAVAKCRATARCRPLQAHARTICRGLALSVCEAEAPYLRLLA